MGHWARVFRYDVVVLIIPIPLKCVTHSLLKINDSRVSCIKTRGHIRIHKLMLVTHVGFSIVVKIVTCCDKNNLRIRSEENVSAVLLIYINMY